MSPPFTRDEHGRPCAVVFRRPAFLPDPNDGSLYSLGGKNNEGLTVGAANVISALFLKDGTRPRRSFCVSFSSRNCRSPSPSWCKLLPAAVRTGSCTWVRTPLKQEWRLWNQTPLHSFPCELPTVSVRVCSPESRFHTCPFNLNVCGRPATAVCGASDARYLLCLRCFNRL